MHLVFGLRGRVEGRHAVGFETFAHGVFPDFRSPCRWIVSPGTRLASRVFLSISSGNGVRRASEPSNIKT
jgi:hypothetical protein